MNDRSSADTQKTTRDRILDTALALFNQQGTGAVSTNHIAAEMEISPGNLYYHFRDKAEIIRELVNRWLSSYDQLWLDMPEAGREMDRLIDYIRRSIELGWELRFYLRELLPLIQADDELKRRHLDAHQRRQAANSELMDSLVEAGLLESPKNRTQFEDMFRSVWILSHFWVADYDLLPGGYIESALDNAVRTALRMYQPLMTDKALAAIREFYPDFQ